MMKSRTKVFLAQGIFSNKAEFTLPLCLLSHSGWRGSVKRIGEKTVRRMEEQFGSNPKDVLAVIGPSICKDCYEVSEHVAAAFQKEFKEEQLL